MLKIISDTSTLYSTNEARKAGFDVAPLSVTINEKSYKEFDEINAEDFVAIINEGHMPKSSQPSVGDVSALYAKYPNDEIINISMADGLSGTWQSASAAASLCEKSENITVVNSRTLCGPHRHIVETAVEMAKNGATRKEVIAKVEKLMDSAKSYLIPSDFAYLRRGGRLSPLVSYVGQAIKFTPIMTQTEDGKHLTIASVKRNLKHAVEFIEQRMKTAGVTEGFKLYVTHAAAPEKAQMACDMLKNAFPKVPVEVFPLSPAFITQGGPGCIAIQSVKAV